MIPEVTNKLSALLLPELEAELTKTRTVLERVPEDRGQFKVHERSRSLGSLAGHTADLVSFLTMVLTRPEFDFGTEHRTPLVMESREQLLARFDEFAAFAVSALRGVPDEHFHAEFRFLFNGRIVFSGSRYMAYRVNTLNHMLHHRAQLGVYLRLLEVPVPALYGPSADEFPGYNNQAGRAS